MGLKFNGIYRHLVRWYDTETGDIIEKEYSYNDATEIDFSRNVLKTKPMSMEIHPDHKPDADGFWFCGYQADKDGRITFQTGTKNRIVISKNETDFLFCSTNQPFRSCFDLRKGGPSQLRIMQRTPGIFISYATQEDAEHRYNGKDYVHPKMSGRAFVYMSPDGKQFTVGRPYGKNGFELRDAIRRFVPNGLSVGWKLSDEQEAINNIEYDNFNADHSCHDSFDGVFNNGSLYISGGYIEIIKE